MATLHDWDSGALPTRLGGNFTLGNYTDVWPIDWVNIDHNGQGPAQLRWDLGQDLSQMSVRVYFRTPPVWPMAQLRFVSFDTDDDPAARPVALAFAGESNGGQLRVLNDNGVVLAASPLRTLMPSRWYRFHLMVSHGTQEARARVWHLHTANASPVWDSGVVTTGLPTSATARWLTIGAVQGSLLLGHARMAHMRVTDSFAAIAPHNTDEYPWDPPAGDYTQVRIVDGGSLINPSSVQLWDYGGRLVHAVSATYSEAVTPPDPDPDPVGTLITSQTFEGQTNGQPLSLSAPWSEVGGGTSSTFTASTSAAMHGTLGARRSNTVGSRMVQYTQSSSSDTRCLDWYVNVRTQPSHVFLLNVLGGSGPAASDVRINADGTVRLRDSQLAVDTSTETLTAGTWYRFALLLTSDSGQFLRVYQGNNSTPLFELQGPLTNPSWEIANFGMTVASDGTTVDMDTIRIAADGWLPPAS